MKFFFLLLVVFSFISCRSQNMGSNCNERRGVVEYGTSRIKLLIAEVNRCQSIMNHLIHKQEWEVETDRNTLKEYDGSNYLNRSVIDRSLAVSADARMLLNRFQVTQVRGMATGIYRTLTTADMILESYGKVIEAPVHVLSKLEEASMGLRSLQNDANPSGKFIVWDFGGNSMQFSVFDGKRSYPNVGFPGSTPIRIDITSLLGKKNSPNPIGAKKRMMVEKYLVKKYFASLNTLAEIKDARVFGIGGVHSKSIASNLETFLGLTLDDKTYTRAQVDQLCEKLVGQKDIDIGVRFPASQASNALTVHSIMDYLGWDKVTVSEQTLTLGYITFDEAWKVAPNP